FSRDWSSDVCSSDLFHHRVQATSSDVLGALIDREGQFRQPANAIFGEFQLHVLGGQQGMILLGQRRIGVAQNAHEIIGGERVKLDADGKAALQFGNQVGRARQVEGARGNKQDVVGAHHSVLGVDGRSLDQGKQVALYALAGDVAAPVFLTGRDLVDLVQEDDAVLL